MLQWLRRAFGGGQQAPDAAELYRLGEAEALRRNHGPAEALLRQALEKDGNVPRYHYALGCVLQATGRAQDAAECYRRALALDSRFVPAMTNLGTLLQAGAGRTPGAEAQLAEALRLFRESTEIAPEYADGWINLGFALERQVRLAEARAAYDRALALDPALADARFNRSLVLLAQGDYREGFREYEWRWPATGYPRPQFNGPEWAGGPLEGKTVFLYAEQGFGDAIQFVRYAAMLEERGARVLLRSHLELRRVFERVRGVTGIVAPQDVPPFDFHCSLLSLAGLFGTTIDTVPAQVPYIRADAALAAQWRERLRGEAPALRVGLVWTSQSLMPDAAGKSAALAALAPLRNVPGVRYYSLQLGAAAREAAAGPVPMKDLTGAITDFDDTAALLDSLDLIVSVDTAVAHLAGAMAKPVWTMLRHAPDWRWYPDERQSRWYPTMRLYRQRRPGDWLAVAEEVARDLAARVAESSVTSPT